MKRSGQIFAIISFLLMITAFPLYGKTLQGEADAKPWSGYWWPLKKGELVKGYRGHPSPIEKYDLYLQGYYPGAATQNARIAWYDPEVPSWYGICNGWANASILENQEFRPSAAHNVFLEVGDKKGLLAAIHAEDETLYEFCRNPEPFHRYLLQYIGEQGLAVAADFDTSEEFWSYPIYSYEMKIVEGDQADQVQCRIMHANDQGFPPDFEGTVEVERVYYYKLDKDIDGNYIKGSGSWQGTSVADHPAIVWVPIARRPERLFIDYDIVKEMALSSGDEYAGTEYNPGHHLLIVEPGVSRSFPITPAIGVNLTLKVALDRQSASGTGAHAVLKRGSEIIAEQELDRNLVEFKVASKTGSDNYSFTLIPDNDNQTGCSIQLYVDYASPYEHWFYGFPQSRYWLGSAGLLSQSGEIAIQVVGNQSLPFGNGRIMSVDANERLLTVLPTTATDDYFSGNQPLAVKISSSEPLNGLVFAGDNSQFWGSTQSSINQTKKRVIPWLVSATNWSVSSELYLAQHEVDDNQLEIIYYKDDGTFFREEEFTLLGKQVTKYEKGAYPGKVSVNGWALVTAQHNGLDGAVLRIAGKKLKDQLPLLSLDQTWLVPHMAIGAGWQTRISLYNPNEEALVVAMACHSETPGIEEHSMLIPPFAHVEIDLSGDLWGITEAEANGAWVTLSSETEFAGFISYEFGSDAVASLPLLAMQTLASRKLPHLAHDAEWWTGVVLLNRVEDIQHIKLTAFAEGGEILEDVALELSPLQKYSDVVGALFTPETMAKISSLQLDQGRNVSAIAVFGTLTGGNRISAFCW